MIIYFIVTNSMSSGTIYNSTGGVTIYQDSPYTKCKELADLFIMQRPSVYHIEKVKWDDDSDNPVLMTSSYNMFDETDEKMALRVAEFKSEYGDPISIITTEFEVRDMADAFTAEISGSQLLGWSHPPISRLNNKYRKLLQDVGYDKILTFATSMFQLLMDLDDARAHPGNIDDGFDAYINQDLIEGVPLSMFMFYEGSNFIPCRSTISQKKK